MTKIAFAAAGVLLFATSAFAGSADVADKSTKDQKNAVAPVEMTTAQMDTIVAAAQPANPGGFGQDRAAWIHANGGSTWGAIASERAGDNGDINNAYKVLNGDLPAGVTPGN